MNWQAERAVEPLLVGGRHELAAPPERGAVEREAAGRGERRELAQVGLAARGLQRPPRPR